MNNILDKIKTNQNVPVRCYDTAVKSVDIFIEILTKRDIKLEKTTDSVDIYDHVDYIATCGDKTFGIDVKSAKKFLCSNSLILEDEWIWIEIKNVNGKNGWLYGKAKYLAYVFLDQIWLINRLKLVEMVERKVSNIRVESKQNAKYNLYSRVGRKDLLTSINLGDIKKELQPIILRG